MKRAGTESPIPETSPTAAAETRRRVVKACQRCRLKKCKCDGATPCVRCKADDTICTYGKHKTSDKTVYRKGYVQMLERQHTQLVAAVQELYRRLSSGESWIGPSIAPSEEPPGTHEILESLGILQQTNLEDAEESDEPWQTFESHPHPHPHPQDGEVMCPSITASPGTQTTFSSVNSVNLSLIPPPTLAVRRLQKMHHDQNVMQNPTSTRNIDQTLPLLTTSLPYKKQGPPFSANSAYMMPIPEPFSAFSFDDTMGLGMGMTLGNTESTPGKGDISNDWASGMDHTFDSNSRAVSSG